MQESRGLTFSYWQNKFAIEEKAKNLLDNVIIILVLISCQPTIIFGTVYLFLMNIRTVAESLTKK